MILTRNVHYSRVSDLMTRFLGMWVARSRRQDLARSVAAQERRPSRNDRTNYAKSMGRLWAVPDFTKRYLRHESKTP